MIKNTEVLRLYSICFILTLTLLIFSVSSINPQKVFSQNLSTTTCQSGITLMVNGTAQTSTVVSNLATISVSTQGVNSSQIDKIIIYADNLPIGRAIPNPGVNYLWEMQWAPGLKPILTTVKLNAQIYYLGSLSAAGPICSTSPIYVSNQSTRAAVLQVTNSPTSWAGPMGSSISIKITPNVIEPNFNPTNYAIYEWSTTIGYINPSQNVAQFTSGTTMGSGVITVKIIYGGAQKLISIPVTINSTTAPLPTSLTTTTTSATKTTSTTTTATAANTIVPTTTMQNPTAQDCVIAAIGKDRFTQINTGATRPTADELAKFNTCFATSNFILPSNFAPIAPVGVKDLTPAKKIKITSLKNETKTVDNNEKQLLKISGKAAPNSTVYIYIFSDPLVLTTKTNANGDWEYSLEDPIEAGNHEVFSVVNRGDGVYERSEPLSFVMGTAEAAEVNPNGLSLKLVGTATPVQSQKGLAFYIIGSVSILVFAIAIFALTFFKKSKTASVQNSSIESEPPESNTTS